MSPEPSIASTAPFGVLAALLALATLSLVISFLPLQMAGLVIALGIAGVKAWIVADHFMELREATPGQRLTAAAAPLFVALIVALTMADVLSR